MIAYFDSSALVKLFLAEPDGPVALEIWNEADHVTTSAVSCVEVRAALAGPRERILTGSPAPGMRMPRGYLKNYGLKYFRLPFQLTSLAMQATWRRSMNCGLTMPFNSPRH